MIITLSTEWLFFHLQKRNQNNTSCPVIYRFNILETLIFFNKQKKDGPNHITDGNIARYPKDKVINENILSQFIHQTKAIEPTALYIYSNEVSKKHESQVQEKIQFTYFDKQDFQNFFTNGDKALNPLLQVYVESKSPQNQVYNVTWSPQYCKSQRRTNINDFTNIRLPLNERLCTFEGPYHMSRRESMFSSTVKKDLEKICNEIVQHIDYVTQGNISISLMKLYFKINKENKLILLYSTGIKVRLKVIRNGIFFNETEIDTYFGNKQDRLLFFNQTIDSPIMMIEKEGRKTKEITKLKMFNGIIKTSQEDQCHNCNKVQEHVYKIKVSQIIEKFDVGYQDHENKNIRKKLQQLNEQKQKEILASSRMLKFNMDDPENTYYTSDNLNFPGILLKLWDKLTYQKYLVLKQNESWMNIQVDLCEHCYLEYTQEDFQIRKFRREQQEQEQKKQNERNQKLLKKQIVFKEQKTKPYGHSSESRLESAGSSSLLKGGVTIVKKQNQHQQKPYEEYFTLDTVLREGDVPLKINERRESQEKSPLFTQEPFVRKLVRQKIVLRRPDNRTKQRELNIQFENSLEKIYVDSFEKQIGANRLNKIKVGRLTSGSVRSIGNSKMFIQFFLKIFQKQFFLSAFNYQRYEEYIAIRMPC